MTLHCHVHRNEILLHHLAAGRLGNIAPHRRHHQPLGVLHEVLTSETPRQMKIHLVCRERQVR